MISARFDALDAAMAARSQAQLVTLAQLIGEAIVAEGRGVREAAAGGTAGQGAGAGPDDAGTVVGSGGAAPTRAVPLPEKRARGPWAC